MYQLICPMKIITKYLGAQAVSLTQSLWASNFASSTHLVSDVFILNEKLDSKALRRTGNK